MAKKTIKAQMKQRRDTKANWAATNPVLLDGELGIVSDDPNLYKVGDGATAWNSLPFRGFDGTLAQELGTSPNAVISQKVVSEKLTELESKTEDISLSTGATALSQLVIGQPATTTKSTNGSFRTAEVSCKSGDTFIVNGWGDTSNNKNWAFVAIIDNNGILQYVDDRGRRGEEITITSPCDGVIIVNLYYQSELIFKKKILLWHIAETALDKADSAMNAVDASVILNCMPSVNSFDTNTGHIEIYGRDSWKHTASISNSVFGFNALASVLPQTFTYYFKTGEVNSNGGQVYLYCIYYNADGTEIRRDTLQVIASNDTYKLICKVPNNTYRILTRFQLAARNAYITIQTINLVLSSLEDTPSDFFKKQNIAGGIKSIPVGVNPSYEVEEKIPVVYVDSVNGSDANKGDSLTKAVKSFAKAMASISEDATIILRGDIHERLNITTNASQRSLRLVGYSGSKNRILGGTIVNTATLVEGDIYSATISDFPSAENFQIFQHEASDESTLISIAERHPLQRGREYRCESSVIKRVASLDAVRQSSELTYYASGSTIYFKIKTGTNLATNPVYIPADANIYGNDGSVHFEMSNIESWYGAVDLSKCHGGKICDSAAKYAYGGGAFIMDNSIGLELIRCEAARAFSGTSTGDGFNAHSATSGVDTSAKRTSFVLRDCWSHDNNDDGYSDHEGCEGAIFGGLFEYNVKGGITPSYGAHDTINGAYIRKNAKNGLYLTGFAEDGGAGTQVVAVSCVCEENSVNYFVDGGLSTGRNTMILINCISIRGSEGFKTSGGYDFMKLINCSDKGSVVVKIGNNITIDNGNFVA